MGDFRIFCAGVEIQCLPSRTIPNILFNVLDDAKDDKAVNITKRFVRFLRPEKIMIDSSGFQLLQGQLGHKSLTFDSNLPIIVTNNNINLSPYHVVRAACNLQPHIMIGLDFPIREIRAREEREKEYQFKSKYNIQWAIKTASLREICCPNIELFLPIQCYTLEDLAHYMREIRGINYDGVSMPIRGQTVKEVASFIMEFSRLGIKKIHILGTTSFPMIALSAYFARHLFEWVSLDSTRWRVTAQNNIYLNPLDLSSILMSESSNTGNDNLFCQCPFCREKSFQFIRDLPYTDRVAMLWSHNFYASKNLAMTLYANATDPLTYETFLKTRTQKAKLIRDLIESLSVIDTSKNNESETNQRVSGMTASRISGSIF